MYLKIIIINGDMSKRVIHQYFQLVDIKFLLE